MKIIQKPTKTSAGVAIIKGKIHHYVYSPREKKRKWIICGDCNEKH